ncbi:protein indeterminate-domain 11-like [Phalaenopsis equestris]|uniref:protein indeterminate-domain 11-like n=1 Tax=Phalaenopsis equestris TaxID=78828 RepID=UPI0009E33AA2|nr:protein indeterminate-domain 11-like [Phalaenopsis equestris]
MEGFAAQNTQDVDLYSNSTASDLQDLISSNPNRAKKKRSITGNLDPNAEVIALSPKSLLAKNKFVCEVCGKGFQRDQNLQLHKRGHNLPWKLKQRQNNEVVRRKVYICPEPSCSNHDPSRALGDLAGIKKHFSRKHGEKRWSCDKCSKKYAVLSDWKAHSKICGTKEYRCDCGTIFSRRDGLITHKAFCEVLAIENYRRMMRTSPFNQPFLPHPTALHNLDSSTSAGLIPEIPELISTATTSPNHHHINYINHSIHSSNLCGHLKPSPLPSLSFSATALQQKVTEMSSSVTRPSELHALFSSNSQEWSNGDFGHGTSVSTPLQLQSFLSCSEFVYPNEEPMGGLVMSAKREEGREEDFRVAMNYAGDQTGRNESTRDFLRLRVALHEELLNLSAVETCMGSSASFG